MSEQNTSGIWHKADGGPLNHCLRIFADDELIAIVGNSDQTMEQIEANADLIAAAPELADVLRELHDFAKVDTSFRYSGRSAAAFSKAAELLRRVGK